MTAFTFNTNITATKRGLGSFKVEAAAADQSPSLPAGAGRLEIDLNGKRIEYAVSHTNDNGVASGTLITAETVLGDNSGTPITGASTNSVGLTAIGFDASTTRYAFVAAAKAQIEIDFADDIVNVTGFPGAATSGTDTATFNTSGAVVVNASENLSNITAAVLTSPTKEENDNFKKYSGWIGQLDNDANNAAHLQSIMGTADSNPADGFDIADDAEYDDKFIPGIRQYLKGKK